MRNETKVNDVAFNSADHGHSEFAIGTIENLVRLRHSERLQKVGANTVRSPGRQAGYTCGGGEGLAQLYANYGRHPWVLGAGLSSAIVAANATAGLSGLAIPRQ